MSCGEWATAWDDALADAHVQSASRWITRTGTKIVDGFNVTIAVGHEAHCDEIRRLEMKPQNRLAIFVQLRFTGRDDLVDHQREWAL
jgi:hypothetical protein